MSDITPFGMLRDASPGAVAPRSAEHSIDDKGVLRYESAPWGDSSRDRIHAVSCDTRRRDRIRTRIP